MCVNGNCLAEVDAVVPRPDVGVSTGLSGPTNTVAPAITGREEEGVALSGTTGMWTGTAPITYTRRWKRCPGVAAAIVADGPGGYWRLGETSGGTARDATGFGLDATHGGSPALGTGGALANDPDRALSLDGVDDMTTRGDAPSLSPTSSGTVEAWVRLESAVDDQAIVIKADAGASYGLQVDNPGGGPRFAVFVDSDGALPATQMASSAVVSLGTWYHVVGTWGPTGARVWVDGVPSAATPVVSAIDDASSLRIGGGLGSWVRLTGAVDEVAIYSTELSAARIQAHRDAGSGTCSTIVGATGASYSPTTQDVGGRIRLDIVADNPDGTAVASTVTTQTVAPSVPVGAITPYAGSSLPAGWRWADGAAASRTQQAALFAAARTTYGAGDGSTTFNVPDLRGRFPLGVASAGTASTLASTGGGLDHSHAVEFTSHEHTVNTSHTHQVTAASHTHSWIFPSPYLNPGLAGSTNIHLAQTVGTGLPVCTGGCAVTTSTAGTTVTSSNDAATGSLAVANPPFLATGYIVKADPTAGAPCGSIWATASGSLPSGATRADGAALPRAGNAALFGCIGTTFGTGDGSTTFNVPDTRGRSALGVATSGTGSTLAATGGSANHAHTVTASNSTHTAYAGDHTHMATEKQHTHTTPGPGINNIGLGSSYGVWLTGAVPSNTTGILSPTTATSSNSGGSTGSMSAAGATNFASGTANAPSRVVEHVMQTTGFAAVGPGTLAPHVGSTPPTGWLVADGSAVSRVTYGDLFATIGTTFGAGDGSITFNLPDLRGRMAFGRAGAGTGSTLGQGFGSLDHTHSATLPNHNHTWSSPVYQHSFYFPDHRHTVNVNGTFSAYADGTINSSTYALTWGNPTTSANGGSTVSTPNARVIVTSGDGGAQTATTTPANVPFLALGYMVKF